jgi:lipopolysaccharide transport system ATP-binding protein
MDVRLAFAVAAHLEPEILIVDEVLAVGDAEFQKKCLGKMKDVAGHGRTILFVSHNTAMISNLCDRCIFLEHGTIKQTGSPSSILQSYLSQKVAENSLALKKRTDREGSGILQFEEIWIENSEGERLGAALSGQKVKICLKYSFNNKKAIKNVQVAIAINTISDILVTEMCNTYSGSYFQEVSESGVFVCEIDKLPLNKGKYYLNIVAEIPGQVLDYISNAGYLDVETGDFFGTGKVSSDEKRLISINHKWLLCGL